MSSRLYTAAWARRLSRMLCVTVPICCPHSTPIQPQNPKANLLRCFMPRGRGSVVTLLLQVFISLPETDDIDEGRCCPFDFCSVRVSISRTLSPWLARNTAMTMIPAVTGIAIAQNTPCRRSMSRISAKFMPKKLLTNDL